MTPVRNTVAQLFAALWQIAPEDLTSAGNQDKIRELQVEDQIEDAEQEEEVQEAMERGLEAESHEVFIDAALISEVFGTWSGC